MKIRNIFFNILAIVTVLAVGFVGFNLLSGAKGYAVTSDSMKDTLSRGDVVFVKPVTFDELQVGDVITVTSSDGERFFTHRVVEINKTDRTVTTRGDANGANDPMPTEEERIVGRMWYSVPLLGHLSGILHLNIPRNVGLIIEVMIAVVLVLANTILPKLISKKEKG